MVGAAGWFGLVGPHAFWQILTIALTCGFLYLYHVRAVAYGNLFHLALDASFVSAGAVALLTRIFGA